MFLLRPLPVYATDMPVVELQTAELFVVCTLRLWVAEWQRCEASPDWRQAYAIAGVHSDGAGAFDDLLHVIATSTTRTLDVRCRKCAHLGDDEGWLLQLFSLLQRSRLAEADAILSHWLLPSAVCVAKGPAQLLCDALAAGGLSIPLRDAVERSLRFAPPVHVACSSNLVH